MGSKTEVKPGNIGGQTPGPPSGYEANLSDFLAWVQLERGLSENTVQSYEADLIQCS